MTLLARVLSIEGFTRLSPRIDVLCLARPAQSAMALHRTRHCRKSGSVAAVTGVDDTWLDKQVDMQTTVEDKLKTLIAQLIAKREEVTTIARAAVRRDYDPATPGTRAFRRTATGRPVVE